jgi:MYXO-CTERM domain-containing protein
MIARHAARSLVLLSLAAPAAWAAPFTPSGTGTQVDPAGGQTVDYFAGPAVTRPLTVIQNFTGVTPAGVATSFSRADAVSAAGQVIYFDDVSLPDLRFTASGNQAGNAFDANNSGTSSGGTFSGLNLRSGTGEVERSAVLTIDFGDYNGTTFNAAANGVPAAAFTVSEMEQFERATVQFFDGTTLLATQTVAGVARVETSPNVFVEGAADPAATPPAANDAYFGYTAAPGESIDRIVLTYTTTATTANSPNDRAPTGALDDLGFASVPEPALLGVAGLGAIALLRRKR